MILTGCGKSGSRFANQLPTIRITSYEGLDDSGYTLNDTLIYQQRIYWHANDPDGVIVGFAYRVLNENNNPIPTPGNYTIDTDGAVTPDNVLNTLGPGWVMHYMPGADQSIPLTNPQARRTIWTTRKYAVINFPAADAGGNPLIRVSKFQVIAVDNRGDITAVPAYRIFSTTSDQPVCFLSTTKGNPDGRAVGAGIRLQFSMHDTDPYIIPTPYHYEFKIQKLNYQTNALISETQWYSTKDEPRINQYLLTRYTQPASIDYDFQNDQQVSVTRVISRVYDLAGVVSDTTSIKFAVKSGFRPETLIYKQRVYGLGDNHYIDYVDESTPEVMPFTIVNGLQRFATLYFKDVNNRYAAINSQNYKTWIRWGWHGEYGEMLASGGYRVTDNPFDKKIDLVMHKDGDTSVNYFSEITHFDLRLNGQPYNFPPLAHSVITDPVDGKQWLRIPLYSPLGQTVVITSLQSQSHSFEVRAVDLQGEADLTPAVFEFDLKPPIPKAQKAGILIIDDDEHNNSVPADTLNARYEYLFSAFPGQINRIDRWTSNAYPGSTNPDDRARHISASDLQPYKLVIYHSDNPFKAPNLKLDHDAYLLYLAQGGNMIISGTHQLSSALEAMVIATQRSFLSSFGIGYSRTAMGFLSQSLTLRPYLIKALGQLGYDNINLQLPSFNSVVNNRQGLSSVTFFDLFSADVIYRLGSKTVGQDNFSPNQTEYDLYNNKPIGLRKINANNRCYIFGFPLSFMDRDQAKAAMNKILQELGMI